MRRIALVLPGLDRIGGAERQVMLLARGLNRRGWQVTVVALSGTGGDAAGELVADGIPFLSLEMRKGLADPRGWIRFHRWLLRERPHLIHAHLPHAAWLDSLVESRPASGVRRPDAVVCRYPSQFIDRLVGSAAGLSLQPHASSTR